MTDAPLAPRRPTLQEAPHSRPAMRADRADPARCPVAAMTRCSPPDPKHVHGGTVVFESGARPADLLVSSAGLVEAIIPPSSPSPPYQEIDARGLLVFPGVIDAHAHLDDPPGEPGEDFLTGTRAAAAGGVTTVLDMPQSTPAVTSAEILEEKRRIVDPKALVDYGLWAGLTPENVASGTEAFALMADAGAVGFKAFTFDSLELPAVSRADLREGLRQAHALRRIVAVHCEDASVIEAHARRLSEGGRDDPFVCSDRRPVEAELTAVRLALSAAEEAPGRIHIAHASHPAIIEAVTDARVRGVKVTAETCSHYLTLTRGAISRCGTYAVCNPPLRELDAVEGLWSLLAAGAIDFVASDHCAYSDEEKSWEDDWVTAPGISGIQIMFPLIVGEALRRGLPLQILTTRFSTAAARLFGLYPTKGSLLPGSEADLTFIDPGTTWTVRRDGLFSKAKGTAYEGIAVRSTVRRTMVRGVVVFEQARDASPHFGVEPGFGRMVRPRHI